MNGPPNSPSDMDSYAIYPYLEHPANNNMNIQYDPDLSEIMPYVNMSQPEPQMVYHQLPTIQLYPNVVENQQPIYQTQVSVRRQSAARRQRPRRPKRNQKYSTAYWLRVIQSTPLTSEERILLQLKGVDGLPWKVIQERFRWQAGKDMKQPALQMRMRRLTQRISKMHGSRSPTDQRLIEASNHMDWVNSYDYGGYQ
ncbi:hypothetical protein K3495_g9190 [Podosphaera aphanis]|nr:hypothetical protein K3495_g9190 [Podosphaera aphanis]